MLARTISNKTWLYALLLAFTVLTFSSHAQDGRKDWLNKRTCIEFPNDCIAFIDQELPNVKPQSFHWYNLVNNLLYAIWEFQDYKRLEKEVDKYLNIKGPPAFKTTVYIFKAKGAYNKDQAIVEEYTEKARELAFAINDLSLNVDRNAEILVLYSSYLSDYDKAKEFSQWAAKKFSRVDDLEVLAEFNTARGHLYNFLKEYDQSREYYVLALKGYEKSTREIRKAIASHNVARTYQQQNQCAEAIPYFEASVNHYRNKGEGFTRLSGYTRLRLAECFISTSKLSEAKRVFSNIDKEHALPYYVDLYEQLATSLSGNE